MCAPSTRTEGRMRLPRPSLRYSAISVMVLTLEAASRPSSCSIATRSSRSRSKTSLAVAIASVLNLSLVQFSGSGLTWSKMLIRPVIRELQIDAEILRAQQGDDGLQLVAIFARYSDSIALNAGLCLLF